MAPGRSCTTLNAEFCPYKKALSQIFALQIREGASDCRKRCAHPLAPSARGLRPQAVGERTVRLSRNISGYGKVLSLRPFGAPPSQREVFRHAEALSLIFALQIRESAFALLTMGLLSQRIRSTPNSEKIIRQPSLFQHHALIGAQRVGGVGVVAQQFFGIGPAYGQGLGNFPLPQVAENQQLRLAVVPAIG